MERHLLVPQLRFNGHSISPHPHPFSGTFSSSTALLTTSTQSLQTASSRQTRTITLYITWRTNPPNSPRTLDADDQYALQTHDEAARPTHACNANVLTGDERDSIALRIAEFAWTAANVLGSVARAILNAAHALALY